MYSNRTADHNAAAFVLFSGLVVDGAGFMVGLKDPKGIFQPK